MISWMFDKVCEITMIQKVEFLQTSFGTLEFQCIAWNLIIVLPVGKYLAWYMVLRTVCRRQKYFITVSVNGTYKRRGKRTNHQDVFCTRHLIGTICIVGIISPLCREKTEIWRSSVICLKTQKVIISRSILFP